MTVGCINREVVSCKVLDAASLGEILDGEAQLNTTQGSDNSSSTFAVHNCLLNAGAQCIDIFRVYDFYGDIACNEYVNPKSWDIDWIPSWSMMW